MQGLETWCKPPEVERRIHAFPRSMPCVGHLLSSARTYDYFCVLFSDLEYLVSLSASFLLFFIELILLDLEVQLEVRRRW
jgi:hypothetical protein